MTTSTSERRPDTDIRDAVRRELAWDPRVNETTVGVQVAEGIVSLLGVVDSYQAKLAAQDAAHRVRGVLDVANEVDVRPSAAHTPADAEIAEAVRRTLEWDVTVPHERIASRVKAGCVTLAGTVDTVVQRDDASAGVRTLKGVVEVVDQLEVRPTAVAPDTVRRSIETALDRQAQREARDLEITVDNAVLTLAGRVRSWPERAAILEVARRAPGVRAIADRLRVDPA